VSQSPPKPDPARGWIFVEKLLAEEELARLDKLTDQELEAELDAEGPPPARVPSAEELLAKARARAAARKQDPSAFDPRSVVPRRGGGDVARAPASGEVAHAPASGSGEIAHAPASGEGAETPPRGQVLRLPRRHVGAWTWSLAAGFALVIGFTGFAKREVVIGFFKGAGGHGDHVIPGPSASAPGPTPEQLAAAVRSDAARACAREDWSECDERLEDARKLDPAGDVAPDVVRMRRDIYEAMHHPPDELEAKPRRPKK
jgi:hypothetical protein